MIRAPAPIVRVSAPRAPSRRRSFRRHARKAGAFIGNSGLDMALGGALFGFAVKQGLVAKLPAIPIVGRTGTAAILLNYWAGHGGGPMVRKAAHAAAVIAGYQLGSTGAIMGGLNTGITTGDADDGYEYAEGDADYE